MKTFKVLGLLMSYPKPEWIAFLDEFKPVLVEEGFLTHMKTFSNTIVRLLLKKSTKYSQHADRHCAVRVKKDMKRDFRNFLETQREKYEKGEEVRKITVRELRVFVKKMAC